MSQEKGKDEHESIKIILVGNSGVGKTSIINRFYKDSYEKYMISTIAMNYIEKNIDLNGKIVKLSIWDTAGQEQYKSCNKLFIKNSKIVIFVYDITKKISFKELDFWYDIIENELGQSPFLGVVGNKADLIDFEEIKEEEGEKKAEEWNAYFGLLSAKEDKPGIDKYFKKIVKLFLESNRRNIRIKSIKIAKKDISQPKNRGGCCSGGVEEGKSNKKENDFKILFLGEKSVGKTNIINSILGKKNNKKYEHSKSLHENKYICHLENKRNINVILIDTFEDYIKTTDCKETIKYSKIIFLIFDKNRKDTFIELKKYIKKIKESLGQNEAIINILGNKINFNENPNICVTKEEGENFAKEIGGYYEEISINDVKSLRNLIKNNIEKCLK